jgi:uncharacterized protein (UPF0276 family)
MIAHRVGLGWRPPLAASIVAHLDEIEVIEVVADDYFDAPASALRPLRTLARQVPLVLHGTSLGLASSEPVATKRLAAMARVVAAVEPFAWSEHLAFVRGGGREIGHLAAPPRNRRTLEGLLRNLEEARRVVGSLPWLENVATLIEPPLSEWSESGWMRQLATETKVEFLLDLHNLHANATNFGFDPWSVIDALPAERIRASHLAGGRMIRMGATERLLDDHLHPTPRVVFDLLQRLAPLLPRPVDVILERDGAWPPFDELLGELREARAAI